MSKQSSSELVTRAKVNARKQARLTLLDDLMRSISVLGDQRDPSTEDQIATLCEAYLSLYREDTGEPADFLWQEAGR